MKSMFEEDGKMMRGHLKRLRIGTRVFVDVRNIEHDTPRYFRQIGVIKESFLSQNGKRYYDVTLEDGTWLNAQPRDALIDAFHFLSQCLTA